VLFKLKKIIKDILYISKLTKTNNKKLTIIFSVFLAQALAALDILIILNFSYLLTKTFSISESLNFVVSFFEVKAFLPLIVILRLMCSVFQNLILKKLELTIQQNLKIYFLNQAFTKRNYSNSDIFYFINTLSDHISFFYSSFASFLNYFLQILAFTSYLFINDTSTISFLFLGITLLFYPIYKLIKLSRRYMDKAYHFGLEVNKDIERVVENTFFIKLLNKEREELDRFSNLVKSLNVNNYENNKYSILTSFVPSFATLMLLSIITIYFSRFFNVSLEFVGITLRLFQSLGNLSGSLNKISNSHVHLTKFYEIEKYNPLINSKGFMLNNSIENELAINFHNVDFSYANSEEKIFKKLNFSIEKNQKIISFVISKEDLENIKKMSNLLRDSKDLLIESMNDKVTITLKSEERSSNTYTIEIDGSTDENTRLVLPVENFNKLIPSGYNVSIYKSKKGSLVSVFSSTSVEGLSISIAPKAG